MSFYSDAGGKGDPAETQEQAVELMLEKLEVVANMYHGFAIPRLLHMQIPLKSSHSY
ncbi:MAG: hypothetical protein V9G21_01280 [Methylotenera sp.]